MSPNLDSSFWQRMGLQEQDRGVFLRAVRDMYPGRRVEKVGEQGYCSFTVVVAPWVDDCLSRAKQEDQADGAFIVQLRPDQHALDLYITRDARKTYGDFAPRIQGLECALPGRLRAYRMDKMEGVLLSHCQPRTQRLDEEQRKKLVNLVESFATFIACSWPSSQQATYIPRAVRADSPISDTASPLSQCTGKVGGNIIPKLAKLAHRLPDMALRALAASTLHRMMALDDYPVTLTHGDLIPSNMLIDQTTWAITGMVDWAEAEWLPFGTSLYGLEYLLGYMDHAREGCPRWRHYDGSTVLRELFWRKLAELVPELRGRGRIEDVLLARDLGVLLWFGFAWDEGRIDRVVGEEVDAAEVECLRAFLGVVKECR
ncbi:hypothetical protein BDV95DRAFT_487611 [Massariosphaeria phaeospora]|uniref:Aminoglycoside phosphotransferase domain-containing protein n=1 Tax=Massariosphaeria phaeospora TaxID=100035 RepID=A0A7C8ID12_9PLEO|nr:hypothetical protein BDV95DRAFT_487611 [Massariosphaeria phaeospora]